MSTQNYNLSCVDLHVLQYVLLSCAFKECHMVAVVTFWQVGDVQQAKTERYKDRRESELDQIIIECLYIIADNSNISGLFKLISIIYLKYSFC